MGSSNPDRQFYDHSSGTEVTAAGGVFDVPEWRAKFGFSDDGNLNVEIPPLVSTNNSTTETLGAGGVFTGAADSVNGYGIIYISVYSDQDSAIDGLAIEQSTDGIHWDHCDEFSLPAGRGKNFSINPHALFMRIIYTNGATPQTEFRLQVILKATGRPSSHRIQDPISDDDDAELVKSVLTGERDDGVFGNAIMDNQNSLRVNSFPYLYSIAEKVIDGHDALLKFGTRTSVSANTPSSIWEGNTDLYAYMTTAQQLKVVSSSASDTLAGTGARTLFLQGVDGSHNEITETINMAGLTTVTTVNSYFRIYRAFVVTCGTAVTNVGKITIRNNAATVEQAVINAGDGQTLMTLWTVPIGKIAYLLSGTFSSDSNKGARVSMFTRQLDGGTLYPWQIKYRAFVFSGNNEFNFHIPFRIPAKTDIEVRVNTPASAGTTSAGATFELWYEDED